MKQICGVFFLIVFLVSCGSAGRKERSQFVEFFKTGQYDQALSYINNNDFFKDPDSRLLALLEKAMLLHQMERYRESSLVFEQAKDLSRQLYTISLSRKFQTAVANDSYDKYYGSSYERSLIHFYLALNHFMLYQQGDYQRSDQSGNIQTVKLSADERRSELLAARAEIAAWDSMLTSLRTEKGSEESVFKNDLLAKTFGAYIHEAVRSRNDDQIALQLYKDAKELLLKNYNSYQSFNRSSKQFIKDFSNFKRMTLDEVENNYVSQTNFQKELRDYLDFKILTLTKAIRPNEYKQQLQIQKPSPQALELVKRAKRRSNVGIVFGRGMIPSKVADQHYYGLGAVLNDPKSSAGAKVMASIGSAVFSVFAAKQLGLLPPPRTYYPGRAYVGIRVSEAMVNSVAIKFELPKIANQPIRESSVLKVFDKSGAEVYSKNLAMINPLGDIATQAVSEDSATRYLRTGARVAGKHVAAILAAYATYKGLKKQNKFVAKLSAVAAYTLAAKGIESSEKADTRYWSTLPGDLRFTDLYLPKGEYTFKVILNDSKTGTSRSLKVGSLNITNSKQRYLLNYRTSN